MNPEKEPQFTPEEIEEAEKELHMQGRAMRVDETLEEYHKEREQSWLEKKKQREEQDKQEIASLREQLGLKPEEKDRFSALADKIPLDEKKPPSSQEILPVFGGNIFGEDDEQTLAGRVVGRMIYDKLVERQDYKSTASPQEIIQMGKDCLEDFKKTTGQSKFGFEVTRPAGKTGFHLNGEDGRVTRDHLFYFSKSTKEWKNPKEEQERAYLTIDPKEAQNLQGHFVDLCTTLYEAGVDFTGKAASPNGMEKRTDNVVLYISASDKQKAGELIKGFLKERGIGQGHVLAAEPDAEQSGLSWAKEPTVEETKLWQQVSGSTERASYNAVVAAKIAPAYLRRIAEAHSKLGHTQEADVFDKEAERVESVLEKTK